MRISISRLHYPVRTLGPGKRIGLWVQGCSIRCKDCISADTWRPDAGWTQVASVLGQLSVWAGEADGLTVSGGEPLDQPQALAALLRGWRDMSSGTTLLFTGYDWSQARSWFLANPGLADAVIAGPYDRSAGQTLALRGSDNQTLHALTTAGEAFLAYERLVAPADRRLDAMFDEDGTVWFAGIPAPGDFERLRQALAAKGHRIYTSAAAPSA